MYITTIAINYTKAQQYEGKLNLNQNILLQKNILHQMK